MIIANTVTLALEDYPKSERKSYILGILNDFFTWAFFVEMICKMTGLGIKNYVRDRFNLFDCIVVVLSIVDFTIAYAVNPDDLGEGANAL